MGEGAVFVGGDVIAPGDRRFQDPLHVHRGDDEPVGVTPGNPIERSSLHDRPAPGT